MRRRFFNNNIKDFDINDYLTIEALEDNLQVLFSNEDLMYGIDGLGWQKLVSNTYSPAISKGQTISFKGNVKSTELNTRAFTISKKCNLKGNCMSLLFGDDAVNNNSLFGKTHAFRELFSGCTTIMQVSDSFLPATTLADHCYDSMFSYCTSLTTSPELPATTLADHCYDGMFSSCTSLTTAPELPATTLSDYCYSYMFYGCTSLTAVPTLPATTLSRYCYHLMFCKCTSLVTVPSTLPATTLANNCYESMFYGCTNLITAPELPATTLASDCYSGMFYGCSSLTVAPELPATTLASDCYYAMFNGCKNLNYIKMLATDIPASNCLLNWVKNVSSIGTFVKNPSMTLLPTGISGIPIGWTVYNDGEEPGSNSLITFTVGGIEYQAEEGMTWQEFINSEYNTNGFSTFDNSIFKGKYSSGFQIYNDNSGYTPTMSSDTIINGHSYSILSGGTGN